LGLLYKELGRAEADGLLGRVADSQDLLVAGRALHALHRFDEANNLLRSAAAKAPGDPAVNTAWGELYLDAHQKADALDLFSTALKTDARWTPALLGAARSLSDDDPPQAIAAASKAIELNPSFVDAYLFVAGQLLDQDHKAEAQKEVQKALAVNPASPDAHALLAAVAFVEDRTADFDSEVAKALTVAPKRGSVFQIAGELTAHQYRFEEAVALFRRGLALEPENPEILSDLGMALLRTGDEAEAREALERSFKLFPRDKPTLNMLTMMDSLDKFETIRDGDIIVKMHKDEVPVLKEYVIPLAHKALATMAAKYEMTVKGPILIEMFPKHDDFAVRTLGLPGMIGALGACFGRVVTLDSPKARQPPGDFLWEATLWHELGHVITIQMSNSRVPRWLTEGISEWEETQARKDWTRPGEAMFARTVSNGQAIKLKDLNEAYQDPKRISLAYYQGRLVVDYMVSTFGQSGLNKLLRAYGQGLDTNAALKQVLNTDLESMQSGFDQYIERTFGPLQKALTTPKDVDLGRATADSLQTLARENPQSYPVHVALGLALRKAADGRWSREPARTNGRYRARQEGSQAGDCRIDSARRCGLREPRCHRAARGASERGRGQRSGETASRLRTHRGARSLQRRGAVVAWARRAATQRLRFRRAGISYRYCAQAARSGRGAHRSRGKLLEGREARRREAAGVGGARNCSGLRTRPGPPAADHGSRRGA
jgi:tetratricopeptide (TPR) repeat protein